MSINKIFYQISGYSSSVISNDDLNNYYIPVSKELFERLCQVTINLSSQTETIEDGIGNSLGSVTTYTTGDDVHDTIIAEIAASRADQRYDKVRIDPLTGERVNKHWDIAMDLMLKYYGVWVDRQLVLPIWLQNKTSTSFNGIKKVSSEY